jgi:hypothetical protein
MRDMATTALILQIERTALVLGGLATAASVITLDPGVVGGVFIGAALGWLNLAVVRLLFERGARAPEQRGAVLGAFLVKTVLLMALVALVVLALRVDAIGFVAGFSCAVLAIMLVPARRFLGGPGPSAEAGAEREE